MKNILIIEDDPVILMGLEASLEEENYKISSANDGNKGFEMALKSTADIIILDIMLPGKNGLDICRELRQKNVNTPILMLTSKKEEVDKVLGFETGADDYLTKPFSIAELKMRLKALLRRSAVPQKEIDNYIFENYELISKKFDVYKDNKPVGLSVKEFQILKYLIEREGEVISRDKLLDDIWGYDTYPTTRTVDNYILSIRKKIEPDPANPKHLITIHTLGYKFIK
ncbi:MAG: response regulator transcription factor [FCB group bacterium]|jgi:DNA-binding response OmpR family regulator